MGLPAIGQRRQPLPARLRQPRTVRQLLLQEHFGRQGPAELRPNFVHEKRDYEAAGGAVRREHRHILRSLRQVDDQDGEYHAVDGIGGRGPDQLQEDQLFLGV